MKKLQPTEYMYASARVRGLENDLVGRERLELLTECRSAEEVMDRLAEYGLTLPESDAPVTGENWGQLRELMLLAALQKAFDEAEAAVPDPAVFRYFRYPYDCNNLKAAIKCGIRGISAEDMLFDFGAVPASEVEALVRKYNTVPEEIPEIPEDNAAMQRRIYMKDLEDKARTRLGRKVKIHETGRKKTVELTFEDDEDLENLLKTLVGQDIFD